MHDFATLQLAAEAQPTDPPDARQQPANFGLEHHDQGDGGVGRQSRQHGTEQVIPATPQPDTEPPRPAIRRKTWMARRPRNIRMNW